MVSSIEVKFWSQSAGSSPSLPGRSQSARSALCWYRTFYLLVLCSFSLGVLSEFEKIGSQKFLNEIRQNSKIGALVFNQHLLTFAAEQSSIWQYRLKRRLMQPISYYWTNNYMLLKIHHHTMLAININKEYSVKQNKNDKLLKKIYFMAL